MIRVLAAALAVPAALVLAAPAQAEGLDVIFQPNLGGMTVNVTATNNYPQAQNCTYTSVSAGGLGSLVPPTVKKPFTLPPNGGTTNVNLPGIPTGSTWQVLIDCNWAGPPLPKPAPDRPSAGSFSGIQTY